MPGAKPDLPAFPDDADAGDAGVELDADARGTRIALREPALEFYHSFVSGALPRRARQPGQALIRACSNKQRSIESILDLTAGWGADGLTLACHGRHVTLVERNPLVFTVLRHALECLAQEPEQRQTAARMRVVHADALDYLGSIAQQTVFDCIYLDPMFPAHKSGAKPAKEMQILQALARNVDIDACFERALDTARRRVVVKRPARAAQLGARKPDLVYREKTVRFDVFLKA